MPSGSLCSGHRVRSFPEDAGPEAGLYRKGQGMLRGIIAALALGLALPAVAESDTAKDIKDSAANATDDAKDALHTDSGTAKTKRHAKKAVRNAKKSARHTKNDAKKAAKDATDNK